MWAETYVNVSEKCGFLILLTYQKNSMIRL